MSDYEDDSDYSSDAIYSDNDDGNNNSYRPTSTTLNPFVNTNPMSVSLEPMITMGPGVKLKDHDTIRTRKKVPLAPNRSFLSWNIFLRDCLTTPPREVFYSEVCKHNTFNDCWTIIDGYVFNITPYIEYHPGGKDILLKHAAGQDCTRYYKKFHSFVNYNTIIGKLLIGKVIPDPPSSQ